MRKSIAILAASLAILSAGASAQEPVAAEQIVLRVEQGQVMTSQGGEFVPAQTGTVLQPGDRIMVTEGAGASVFYDDACVGDYSQPGVHVIARRCDAPVASSASGLTPAATVGLVAAGVVVAAVAIGGGGSDDNPSPPVSR